MFAVVRRGMWFIQEESVLKPCDGNLAIQVEHGRIKLKPFRIPAMTTMIKVCYYPGILDVPP